MLRIASDDIFERQIAAVNMIADSIHQNGLEIHAGQCDCEKSVEAGFLIVAATDKVRCMICGKPLRLTHIPFYEVETRECKPVIVKRSGREFVANTVSTSRIHTH